MGADFSIVKMPSSVFPVYYLEGDDDFILAECSGEIKALFPENALSDFNYERIEASKSFRASQAEASLCALPFLADHRIVEITSFQLIPAEEREKIAGAVSRGLGKSVLIVLSRTGGQGGRPSARQKSADALLKSAGAYVDCSVNDRNWNEWVRRLLRRHSIDVDYSALQVLRSRLGTDYGLTLQELKKLETYSAGKRRITASDVRDVASMSPAAQIYKVSEHIVAGNAGAALSAFYAAFLWLIALWVLICKTLRAFLSLDRGAGWLLLPYLIWVTAAGYLNLGGAILNG